MQRDGTARGRIRHYLATHGPVEDSTGRAVRLLRLAIAYQGSPAAFMQMLAAMDRDGEIERTIKGKRTFRIAGVDRTVAYDEPTQHPRPAAEPPTLEIDYDRLARAVVGELLGRLVAASAIGGTEPQHAASDPRTVVADENARLIEERNEFARRLEEARRHLDELLGSPEPSKARGSRPGVASDLLYTRAGNSGT